MLLRSWYRYVYLNITKSACGVCLEFCSASGCYASRSLSSLQAEEAQQPQILVFAAASLTEAVQEVATSYEKTAHVTVKSSFDSSSTLARQIEA
jgi:ABC-type molybdate transport system substrate-binding protein